MTPWDGEAADLDLSRDAGLRAAWEAHAAELLAYACRRLTDRAAAAAAACTSRRRPRAPAPSTVPDRPAPAPPAVDVRLGGVGGGEARATLAARSWGTAIRLEASGLDPAARYGVWLAAQDGGRVPAGSFRPTSAGSVELHLSTALPLTAGRMLGVTQLPDGSAAPLDVLEARLRG